MRAVARNANPTKQTICAKSATPSRTDLGRRREIDLIRYLQGTIGNQAALRMLRGIAEGQLKLQTSEPGDAFEKEADRVADQVMHVPASSGSVVGTPLKISRKCQACEEEEKLQEKPAGPRSTAREAPSIMDAVLRSAGQPLDEATRAYFEPRFGRDFSAVRVHTGGLAEQSARDVNARAYTSGHDIVFDAGEFAPGTHEGRRLLAHELTHVVQQTSLHPSESPSVHIQRQPHRAGRREATVEVLWSEDEDKFYDRVVAALGRSAGFRGIDSGTYNAASATERTLRDLVRAFQQQYHEVLHRQPKEREAVKVRLSAFYDPQEDSLTGKTISFVTERSAEAEAKTPPPAPEAPAACATTHKANETDDERVTREINETTCFIAKSLLIGDRQDVNAAYVNITIASGSTYPSKVAYEGHRERRPEEARLTYASAYAVVRPQVELFHIAIAHTPSVSEITYSLGGHAHAADLHMARTYPLPPKGAPAAPTEEAEDDECHESDVDYGECLRMQRAEAYQEGIAAAEEEFKEVVRSVRYLWRQRTGWKHQAPGPRTGWQAENPEGEALEIGEAQGN
jgi:hypothetical protein